MDIRIIETAAKVLRIDTEQVKKHCKPIPEDNAFYFCNPVKGGLAVIVASNGEKLGAASSVSFDRHLAAFRSGKRN